ncbi:MAG: pyridoxal-phosphate dependent enzyme [Patescibacteria group bacterium]
MDAKLTTAEKPKFAIGLRCLNCGEKYSFKQLKEERGTTVVNLCYNGCLGPLEIEFDYETIAKILTPQEVAARPETFWRLRELQPVNEIKIIDRPYTPLVRSRKIGKELGIELFFKLDLAKANPTRSFKDRPATLAFNRALELGHFERVFVASTGNLAVATAYLARTNDLPCRVYIPRSLGECKKNAIREQLGEDSEILELDANFDECLVRSVSDCQKINETARLAGQPERCFVPNNTTRTFYKEGSKTSGSEIALQIAKEIEPDREINIFYPIGTAALLCGANKGINELKKLKLFENPHRIFGVQPDTCSPVVTAWEEVKRGKKLEEVEIRPLKKFETIAKSIAIGNPGSGKEALAVFAECGGGAIGVREEDIFDAELELIREENLFPQFVGGTVLAGIQKALATGEIEKGAVVVANLTGFGERIRDDIFAVAEKYGREAETKKLLGG